MTPTPYRALIVFMIATTFALPSRGQGERATSSPEAQIAAALSAAPEDRREDATVLGYDSVGKLIELRKGSNEIICLADDPKDERFQVACYHDSLEPFMARGRELRAQGLGSTEALEARHQEADEGKLELPESPAALYNLGGDLELYDSETGAVRGGHWVWSIYTPYATEASTGLPTTPQAPGAPWIMRPGTASSHIMVVQPRDPVSSPD